MEACEQESKEMWASLNGWRRRKIDGECEGGERLMRY